MSEFVNESAEHSSEEESSKWLAQVDLLDLMPVECNFSDCVTQTTFESFESVPVTEYASLGLEQLYQLVQWSEQVADGLNTAYFQLRRTLELELRAKEKLLDELLEKSTGATTLTLFS